METAIRLVTIFRRTAWSIFAASAILVPVTRIHAQFDIAVEGQLLDELLREGRYTEASTEARRLASLVRPNKSLKPGPWIVPFTKLLISRGIAEHRIGSLDTSDAAFAEAFKIVPDFRRLVAASAPTDDAEVRAQYFLPYEVLYLGLLDASTEALIDRAHRAARSQLSDASDPAATMDHKAVEKLYQQIDERIHVSMDARRTAIGRISQDSDDPASRSPYLQMMTTQARPQRLAGLRYLEASQLPWTLASDTGETASGIEPGETRNSRSQGNQPTRVKVRDEGTSQETPAQRKAQALRQLRRSENYLSESSKLSEQAIVLGLASFQSTNNEDIVDPVHQMAVREAATIRAETSYALAAVEMHLGKLDLARQHIDRALAELRSIHSKDHPDLVAPLLLSAEIAIRELQASLAAKDAVAAQQKSTVAMDSLKAARNLLESANSEFAPDSPLHNRLKESQLAAEQSQRLTARTLTSADATDTAARRALSVMSKSEAPRRPKPIIPVEPEPVPGGPPLFGDQ